jgi:hypothetical protein
MDSNGITFTTKSLMASFMHVRYYKFNSTRKACQRSLIEAKVWNSHNRISNKTFLVEISILREEKITYDESSINDNSVSR